MIKIGITGSLASGKSTVAKMISSGKYPLYNIKIENQELLVDCGAEENHGCGVSRILFEAISGRCDACVSRSLFLKDI